MEHGKNFPIFKWVSMVEVIISRSSTKVDSSTNHQLSASEH